MSLAAFTPYVLDHFLAGEPAVNKEIVEAHVLDGRPVEHHLQIADFVLEVLSLALLHLGFGIPSLVVACIDILLGKALGLGSHSTFFSLKGKVNKHLGATIGTTEEESLVTKDASATCNMGVNASKHLAFTTCLRNVGVIRNHADRIFGVSGIASDGDGKDQLLVDIGTKTTAARRLRVFKATGRSKNAGNLFGETASHLPLI